VTLDCALLRKLTVILGALTLAGLPACEHSRPLDPGEFTSIAPDIVLAIEYETPDFRVTAHRFSPEDQFRVTVETARDNGFRHCISDDGFHRLLGGLESLRIRRRIDAKEVAKLGKKRRYHRLRYAAAPPMEAYEEVLSPLPSGFLLVESDGFAYELSLSTLFVEQLGQSCRPLRALDEAGR
jgi:hypothetical protein